MILNPNKNRTLVVSRSRTVNSLRGDLVLSGVSIHDISNLDILGVKFDSKLTFEVHVCSIVFSCLSENWYFGVKEACLVDTSVLLHCYHAFVLPIVEYCPPVWGSTVECHLQLLKRQVCSVARLCSSQSFL